MIFPCDNSDDSVGEHDQLAEDALDITVKMERGQPVTAAERLMWRKAQRLGLNKPLAKGVLQKYGLS